MESAVCARKFSGDDKGIISDSCALQEDQFAVSSMLPAFVQEAKSADDAVPGKGACPKLVKVASEKSIFSSIRERLDPLASLFQGGIEEIIDRRLRKSDSAAETQEIPMETVLGDGTALDVSVAEVDTCCETDTLMHGKARSVSAKDELGELGGIFRKSSSAESLQSHGCQIFTDNDAILLPSVVEDAMFDDDEDDSAERTSCEMPDFDDKSSLETFQNENLRISTRDIAAQHFSFESCDYAAKEVVFSRPLQPLTNFLWKRSRSFVLSHKVKIIFGILVSMLWLLFPFPSFMSGLVVGIILASGMAWLLQWLGISNAYIKQDSNSASRDVFAVMHDSSDKSKMLRSSDTFQGWMNEISSYEPDKFHITQTRSVFVTITNSTLRLETPKYNLHRRAMWQERLPIPEFILTREFSLTGAKILLVPNGLVKKRIWCKKYPICVVATPIETDMLNSEEIDTGLDVLKAFDSLCDTPVSKSDDESVQNLNIDAEMESVFENEEDVLECHPRMAQLFLFARANREKEEWYRRFTCGSRFQGKDAKQTPEDAEQELFECKEVPLEEEKEPRSSVSESVSEIPPVKLAEAFVEASENFQTDYLSFMSRYVQPKCASEEGEAKSEAELPDSESAKSNLNPPPDCANFQEAEKSWLNALLSRLFYDFLHERFWAEKMKEKLQAMLSKIHVPQFIDQLTMTDINLGHVIPLISDVLDPYLDERGLWIDLNIFYEGGFSITVETKCNLMKVMQTKKEDPSESPVLGKRSAVTHSDEEDSAESSTDEELPEESGDIPEERRNAGSATSKRLLRLVDKITQSRYFQHAADYKYIKKALKEVSNTPLVLVVELSHLSGTLSINIPPPPTDRLWYGFKGNPSMRLSVKPRVGERVVNVTHITEWFEKKLELEFQRIYVMPNMDDLIIPLMCDQISSASSQKVEQSL